jgi:oligoribonuclease
MIENELKSKDNLVWLDMEMTGLDSTNNVILEIAVIITDKNLNSLMQSPSYAIYQETEQLTKMDKWNYSVHTKSGLIERVKQSTFTVASVEQELLNLIEPYIYKAVTPLCGNTIYKDREFLKRYMPTLEAFMHYRNIDISTIKELVKRWYPNLEKKFIKHNKHEALADVEESIKELEFYRQNIFINDL